MPHVFGRSLEFSFTPIIDNEPVEVDSLVSARIFLDEPTDLQLDTPATTGYIQAITTWKKKGLERVITFSAIADPSPHSTVDYEQYWVAVNFVMESGGATVFVKEPLYVYRPDAVTSKISTRFDDIYRVEPKLEEHYTIQKINGFIVEAKKDILRWFKGLKIQLKELGNLYELNDACSYLAAQKACFSLASSQEPIWFTKSDKYEAAYERALNSAQPTAGEDGGTPEQPARTTGMVIMLR